MHEGNSQDSKRVSTFWRLKTEFQQKEMSLYKKSIREAMGNESLEVQVGSSEKDAVKVEDSSQKQSNEEEESDQKLDILSKILPAVSLAEQLSPWTLASPYLQALGYDKIKIRCERTPKSGHAPKVREVTFFNPLSLNAGNNEANNTINSESSTLQTFTSIPEGSKVFDGGAFIKIENVDKATNQQDSNERSESEMTELPLKAQTGAKRTNNHLNNDQQTSKRYTTRQSSRENQKSGPTVIREHQIYYQEEVPHAIPKMRDSIEYPKRASTILEEQDGCLGSFGAFAFGKLQGPNKQRMDGNVRGQPVKYNVGEQASRRQATFQKAPTSHINPAEKKPRIFNPNEFSLSPMNYLRSDQPLAFDNPFEAVPQPQAQPVKVTIETQTLPINQEMKMMSISSYQIPKKEKIRRPRGRPFGWRKHGPNAPAYFITPPVVVKKDKELPSGSAACYELISSRLDAENCHTGRLRKDSAKQELQFVDRDQEAIYESEDEEDSRNFMFALEQAGNLKNEGNNQADSQYQYAYQETEEERLERKKSDLAVQKAPAAN